MSEIRRALVGAVLALCAGSALATRSIAPPTLDDETTQTHQEDTHVAMAIWVPTEVFLKSAGDSLDPVDLKRFVDALEGYVIIGLIDVNITVPDGDVVPVDATGMRASARLKFGDRAARLVLREKDLPPMAAAAAQEFKKLMAGMTGKLGDSADFVVFKDADEHGRSLSDPRGSGAMTLTFDKETFTWSLPLVSVQALRVDRATGDTFPGDYDFSPFTGNRLAVAK